MATGQHPGKSFDADGALKVPTHIEGKLALARSYFRELCKVCLERTSIKTENLVSCSE